MPMRSGAMRIASGIWSWIPRNPSFTRGQADPMLVHLAIDINGWWRANEGLDVAATDLCALRLKCVEIPGS